MSTKKCRLLPTKSKLIRTQSSLAIRIKRIIIFIVKEIIYSGDKMKLLQYVGVWYEIARIPNFFQKKCQSNTTAEYILQDDGNIKVINRCMKSNGNFLTATGIAKVEDTQTFSKLKVSFVKFLGANLFWGDYWIIGLDKDYQWVIVGDPGTKFGWILSRTASISSETRETIDNILKENGYLPERFVLTNQQ
jgi:apolipoprotein D and lipocalin family protein